MSNNLGKNIVPVTRVRKNYKFSVKINDELQALKAIINRTSSNSIKGQISESTVKIVRDKNAISENEIVEIAISLLMTTVVRMVNNKELGADVDLSDVMPPKPEVDEGFIEDEIIEE